jgi:hypothetical protein
MASFDRRFPIAPITIPPSVAPTREGVRRLHFPKQPISAPSYEHIAGGTRRKWGETHHGESMVALATQWIGKGAPSKAVAQNHHSHCKTGIEAEFF